MAAFLYVHVQEKDMSRCVGTSHGWSILVKEETSTLHLLNPNTGARIQLPPSNGRLLDCNLVTKAILSADPAAAGDFFVVVIHGFGSKVAVFDSKATPAGWIHPIHLRNVKDIVCHRNNNNLLLALDKDGNLEAWDLKNGVTLDNVKPPLPQKWYEVDARDLYSCRWYVVQSWCDIFLVSRIVGEFVGEDGVPVYDPPDHHGQPLVCPYRTLKFEVFKLNEMKKEWEEVVGGIGEYRALFVGGSHSASVSPFEFPEVEGNSIYFTDDYWDRMDEDTTYGGHDLGVYSLADERVKQITAPNLQFSFSDSEKIEPPPFWLLPSSCF